MDVKQLKYFLAIAEEEQITAAAKKLHISQPPLSQQLKMLEDELGVKLVERGSRKIKLTDAGRILRDRAEQIIDLTDTTKKELSDSKAGLHGVLSIGTISSSGAALLPERICSFHKKFPDISFSVYEGNTYKLLEILNHGLIEIGIVRTPFNIEDFESVCLPMEPMAAVMTDELYKKFNDKKIIELNELKDKPIILYRRFEKIIEHACENAGFEPNIFCKNEDARTTLLWADSGTGIAVLPKSASNLIKSEKLRCVEIDEPSIMTQIAVIWVKNRYISTAAKNFIDLFR